MKEYEAFGEMEPLTSEPYTIMVKYHEGASRIGGDIHGVMCDLAASETVELKQGEVKIIPLGVSMKLPYGDFGIVVPRSSTCLKHGIMMANSNRERILRRRRRVGIRRLCDQGHSDRARNANRAVHAIAVCPRLEQDHIRGNRVDGMRRPRRLRKHGVM